MTRKWRAGCASWRARHDARGARKMTRCKQPCSQPWMLASTFSRVMWRAEKKMTRGPRVTFRGVGSQGSGIVSDKFFKIGVNYRFCTQWRSKCHFGLANTRPKFFWFFFRKTNLFFENRIFSSKKRQKRYFCKTKLFLKKNPQDQKKKIWSCALHPCLHLVQIIEIFKNKLNDKMYHKNYTKNRKYFKIL